MKNIMWTTKYLLKSAIKGAYLDFYGINISDECIRRIIKYHEELKRVTQNGEGKVKAYDVK